MHPGRDQLATEAALQYPRLRQLKEVRKVPRDADPRTTDLAKIAANHGFNQPARFANLYRATFGKPPSATLQRPVDRDAP